MSDLEASLGALAICTVFAASIFVFALVYSEFKLSTLLWTVVFALGVALFTYATFNSGIGVGVIAVTGCLLAAALGGAPFLLYAVWRDRRAK